MEMRLYFPNSRRPKQAAKRLASTLDVPLSAAQRATARACGFRDWHEMEGQFRPERAFTLDQNLPREQFIKRHAQLSLALSKELSLPDGDAQYALSNARLTGDIPPNIGDQISIRLKCWRETVMPFAEGKNRGSIGIVDSKDFTSDPVILLAHGAPTYVISHGAVSTVADFEYVNPPTPPSLFLPMRLYTPYGYWVEEDGSKVIFSRDYKPLWRKRQNAKVERLVPWEEIKFKDQIFLWGESEIRWGCKKFILSVENYLKSEGLVCLPVMADVLPLLLTRFDGHGNNMGDGANLIRIERENIFFPLQD